MIRASLTALASVSLLAGIAAPAGMRWSAPVSRSGPELPLTFVAAPGGGETPQFIGRGHGCELRVSPTEAVLAAAGSRRSARMRVRGADPRAALVGEAPRPGRVNYFLGKDLGRWQTDRPTFGAVRVREAYPGIDLVYYSGGGELEYDFVVRPGADPGRIALQLDGASAAADGSLTLAASGLRMGRPVGYQEVNGVRRSVDARFVAAGDEVRFALGSYDASRPLIIDPTVSFSTLLGGTAEDQALAVTIDAQARTYVAGRTTSLDLATGNAEQPVFGGGITDAFVARLSADGRTLQTVTYFGGLGDDTITDIALDDAGDLYLTGATNSSDLPLRTPFLNRFQGGTSDAFVVKLNADLNELEYSTYLGSGGQDVGEGIAIGPSHTAYVTGKTGSIDFPVTALAFQRRFGGGTSDTFVTRLAEDGRTLRYSTFLGGLGEENFGPAAGRIAVDEGGNAYVTGTTTSPRYPVTATAYQRTLRGGQDIYVTKLAETGATLVYSTLLGGGSRELAGDLAINAEGSAVVTGITDSLNFPVTAGTFQPRFGGGTWDTFVTRLAPTGQTVVFSTYLGGRGDEGAIAGAVTDLGAVSFRPGGELVVAGRTDSFNFPLVTPLQTVRGGFSDAFFSRFSDDGKRLLESTYLGGGDNDVATDLSLDSAGDVTLVGFTASRNFPRVNAAQSVYGGGFSDAWILRLDEPPLPTPKPQLQVSPEQLEFGTLRIGQNRVLTLTLRNTGKTDLNVTVGSLAAPFTVTEGTGSFVIGKNNKSRLIRVRYLPTTTERSLQTLTITSTDPIRPAVNVSIAGKGMAAR